MSGMRMTLAGIGLICLLGHAADAAEKFVVATGGRPEAAVMLLPDSGPIAQDAVTDLRRALATMCGAAPEMADSFVKGRVIVVGLAETWSALAKDTGPAARLKDAAPESFLLQSTPDRLLILGKDPMGVSHGVYSLLRDLGCRWYFIGPDWEVIPEAKTVAVEADRVEGPAMRVRKLNCGMGQASSMAKLFEDWSRRNRMGSAYGQAGISHAYTNYVPESLFKEHPEYFAWVSADGDAPGDKQNGLQPCTTNPEVVKLFCDGGLSILRKRGQVDPTNTRLLSVSPNDNTGNMCRCERCRAVGSYTDCALLLANQVAEAIHAEFPDTLVGFMAYGRVSAPPSPGMKAHPNVIVSMATAYNWRTSFQEMLKAWPRFVRHLIVREYYCISQWGGADPDSRGPKLRDIAATVGQWHGMGVEGIEAEMNQSWGSTGLRFWGSAELMWNPDASPDEIAADFYRVCWGKAAAPMRRYYERWERGEPASDRSLALAFDDLSEAVTLADSPAIRRRVDQMTLYLHWYHLKTETDRIVAECKKQKLGEEETQTRLGDLCAEGNNLIYRMRTSFLLHGSPKAYRMTRDNPPYTAAEVDEVRQRDVAFYRQRAGNAALEMADADVFFDLVPLVESRTIKGLESADRVDGRLGTVSYLVRGKTGDAIRLTFEKPATEPTTTPKAGKPVADEDLQADDQAAIAGSAKVERQGRVEVWYLGADGKENAFVDCIDIVFTAPTRDIDIKPERDGLYLLTVKVPRGKALRSRVVDRPHVIAADARTRRNVQPLAHLSGKPPAGVKPSSLYYFYVPAGTQSFSVAIDRLASARPVSLEIGPVSGKPAFESKGSRDLEWFVKVPAGMDGEVWRLRVDTDTFKQLALGGIPPYVATEPRNLLVPRDEPAAKQRK